MAKQALDEPLVIADFTGQAENAHIGFGAAVGVDLYTTKQVARLSRKMEKKSGSVITDFPHAVTVTRISNNSIHLYAQDEDGNVYKSTNEGDTWTLVTGNSGSAGKGLIAWENWLFSITTTDIDIYGPLDGSPAWDNTWWTTATGSGGAGQPALESGDHYPFADPASTTLYICNKNKIASIEVILSPFDPADDTTFQATTEAFTMPSFYVAETIGFLPPDQISIGVTNSLNPSQADVVIWDGVQDKIATNVITLPGASGPVKQFATRNGVLYGVTNQEHGVYTINGTSAELVDRIGLRITNRLTTGEQYTTRVFSTIYPSAIDFLGPELLTGGSNTPQPVTQISNTGMFPYGVWSVNIENGVVGTRFPLSHGDITALYSTDYKIGFIRVIRDAKVLVGWQKGSTYGIDALNKEDYITTASQTFVESELFEVGTRTVPRTFGMLLFTLVTPLLADQEIQFYYRKSQSEAYSILPFTTTSNAVTFTELGTSLSGYISPLPFQESRYIQIAFTVKTGTSTVQTPQLRTVYLV